MKIKDLIERIQSPLMQQLHEELVFKNSKDIERQAKIIQSILNVLKKHEPELYRKFTREYAFNVEKILEDKPEWSGLKV